MAATERRLAGRDGGGGLEGGERKEGGRYKAGELEGQTGQGGGARAVAGQRGWTRQAGQAGQWRQRVRGVRVAARQALQATRRQPVTNCITPGQ